MNWKFIPGLKLWEITTESESDAKEFFRKFKKFARVKLYPPKSWETVWTIHLC